MSPEQVVDQLEGELRHLEAAFEREIANQRKASRAILLVSAVIALVVVAFVYANYRHFEREWTSEKFQASLQRELEELSPTAERELTQLSSNVLPVYQAELRTQFERLGPTLAAKLGEQMQRLAADLERDAHARVAATEERIRDQTEELIFECYPDMRDETVRQQLTESFERTTECAVTQALTDFDALYRKDVEHLTQVLTKFDAPIDPDTSTVDLQKRFLSLWLRQVDQEIQKL